MVAGRGDALRGVKTTDVKTVKQVSSKSGLAVVWYGEEDAEVSGSEGGAGILTNGISQRRHTEHGGRGRRSGRS